MDNRCGRVWPGSNNQRLFDSKISDLRYYNAGFITHCWRYPVFCVVHSRECRGACLAGACHGRHFIQPKGWNHDPIENDTFLRALLRQPVEYTPMWLMRQAGRYLPEYLRNPPSCRQFHGLCQSPDLATEVTRCRWRVIRWMRRFCFRTFSPCRMQMGLGLYFAEGEGPKFERRCLRDEWKSNLTVPDLTDKLRYVIDAVKQIALRWMARCCIDRFLRQSVYTGLLHD